MRCVEILMPTRKIAKRPGARRALPPVYELGAFSVFGFCVAHGLSKSAFYALRRAGEGPRIMKCGTRTLISVEAAAAWRRARERDPVALASRHRTAARRRARAPAGRRAK
jgi:hypothetical protein